MLVRPAVPAFVALVVLAGGAIPARAQTQTSMHGGIEVGAKGVKVIVLQVTIDKDGHATKVGKPKLSQTINTTLAALKDGKYRADAVEESAEAVRTFFEQMQKAPFRVPPRNIYVVGSSGLPDAPNKPDLIAAVERVTRDATGKGKALMFIDQVAEVRLPLLGLVEPEKLGDTVFVDVGSGSTKCGYIVPEGGAQAYQLSAVRTRIDGTVAFTRRAKEAAKATATDFVAAAAAQREAHVAGPLGDELENRPGLVNRNRVLLSGGIVWAMVTLIKPEAVEEPMVTIAAADIERFYQLATRNPNAFPEPSLASITDEKVRELAAKDVKRVKDAFTPENLVAGAEILRGVAQAFRLGQERKALRFAREGYIAWIYAYVKESATRP